MFFVDALDNSLHPHSTGLALQEWLAETGKPRDAVWVTSKADNASVAARRVEASCRNSLRRLRLESLDLFLVHSPFSGTPIEETWEEMEKLVALGLVRHIGVSNFDIDHLQRLLAVCKIKPAVNQVERHTYLQQTELLSLCRANGVMLSAYAPLASLRLWPGLAADEAVERVATQSGASAAAVLLAWQLNEGVAVVTTSSNEAWLADALTATRLQLSAEACADIAAAGAKEAPRRRFWVKEFAAAPPS